MGGLRHHHFFLEDAKSSHHSILLFFFSLGMQYHYWIFFPLYKLVVTDDSDIDDRCHNRMSLKRIDKRI